MVLYTYTALRRENIFLETFYWIMLAIVFGLAVNWIRFHFSSIGNRITLFLTSIILVLILFPNLSGAQLYLSLLALVVVASLCFHSFGGPITSLLALFIWTFINGFDHFIALISFPIAGFILELLNRYIDNKNKNEDKWFSLYVKQSKQLHIYREISTSMQQTLKLEKILHIILTAVTAGYGFGFNRAMIFFMDEDKKILQGKLGIGPMNPNQGFQIWERIISANYKFNDLVDVKEGIEKEFDNELNRLLKQTLLPYKENTFLHKLFETNQPQIVNITKLENRDLAILEEYFGIGDCAIMPLVNQGKKVGMLIIDNIVNQNPIKIEDFDNLIPLANQAAVAIEHAQLYEETERLTLLDGLTSLYNQRAMQRNLERYIEKNPLSLILLDIDNFKFFNDRNGHLLGNDVLVQVAHLIQTTIEPYMLACRFGGEEFTVILPNTPLSEATNMAEKLRLVIEQSTFPEEQHQPNQSITVSVGVASTENPLISTKEELIYFADQALYAAKAAGKNMVKVFEENEVWK